MSKQITNYPTPPPPPKFILLISVVTLAAVGLLIGLTFTIERQLEGIQGGLSREGEAM